MPKVTFVIIYRKHHGRKEYKEVITNKKTMTMKEAIECFEKIHPCMIITSIVRL